MTANRFVTVHVLVSLGLHNLNRDGNGLPKSQFDGGVQRARLSSQSIKRGARRLYREAGHDESVRTRLGALEITRRVRDRARQRGARIDLDAVIDTAVLAVRSLYTDKPDKASLKSSHEAVRRLLDPADGPAQTAPDNAAAATSPAETAGGDASGDTITFISTEELDTFSEAILAAQAGGGTAGEELVRDSTSASLEIAAFGRMFAKQPHLGTLGAVSVSHATTVHQMQLVTDYFTAVEEVANTDNGAAHIGEAYFTSGTYYRSFTIDADQLERSWSAFHGADAAASLRDLVRSLILALPSGKVGATNAGALPDVVLAEVQGFRVAYGFEEPIRAGEEGGYAAAAARSLADQRRQALAFDPALFGDAAVAGATPGADFQAAEAAGMDGIADFVVDKVFEGR